MKILCKCGCGQLTSGKKDHGKLPLFVRGHNRTGLKIDYKSRPQMRGRIPWNKNKDNQHLRKTGEYVEWRLYMLKTHNYTCATCGQRGGRLNVHHKRPVFLHPELIYNKSNGVVLCVSCHKKVDHTKSYHEAMDKFYKWNYYLLFNPPKI